jgi:ABC-type tungstate transport system permease subunit
MSNIRTRTRCRYENAKNRLSLLTVHLKLKNIYQVFILNKEKVSVSKLLRTNRYLK